MPPEQSLSFLIIAAIAKFALVNLGMVLPFAALLTWMERRQSAYMQDRLGPTRAHFMRIGNKPVTLFGLVHIVADSAKMFFKEPFMPDGADKAIFRIAPAVGFVSSMLIMSFVPFGPTWAPAFLAPGGTIDLQLVKIDTGLLWIFGMASLGIYGTALAGWSSNNKFAMLGGLRASAQIISYEIALGLTLVGMLLVTGTAELSGMLQVQHTAPLWGWLPRWGIFLQPVGAILFFVAAMAETKRAPFDMPEGESEIIGYFLEYSSMGFGLFMLGEFVEVVVLSAIFTTLFLGGWALPWVEAGHSISLGFASLAPGELGFAAFGFVVFAAKVLFMCAVQLQVRWTLPRFRYDQLMDVGWKMLLPLALLNVTAATVLLWCDPSLHLMMLVGLGTWGLFAMAILAGPKMHTPKPKPRIQPAGDLAHGH